jgi:hypothetical protein
VAMLLLLSAMIAMADSAPQDAPVVASSRLRANGLRIGSCTGDEGALDLRRLSMLGTRSLTIPASNSILRIRDETVIISEGSRVSSGRIRVYDIGQIISEDQDLDISLSLGFYNDEPVVYWKENFLHRSYRQGIISVEEEPRVLCEGRGGVDRSH